MSRGQKFALLVGFTALTIALFVAVDSPPTGYELNIYESTPVVFWVGAGIALFVSLIVSFDSHRSRRAADGAHLLAATTIWSIVALPLVRGYFFYGQGDALSHLGLARSFASGASDPLELLHPGVHLMTIVVSGVTGFPFSQSLMFSVLLFTAVFFVFAPLVAREISGESDAVAVGLFIALLLLPINHVATTITAHPSSQAIQFVPLILFLLFVYLQQPTGDRYAPSPIGVVLGITSLAVVFVHPQETLNVIVIFGSVALLQFIYRRYKPNHTFSSHHPVYLQTAFLVVLFLWRAPENRRVQRQVSPIYESLFGTRTPATAEVAGRASSVSSVGGGIEELFLKLFFIAFLFSVVAGLVMLASLSGRLDDISPEQNAYNKYLTVAFVPLTAGTVFVFIGNFGDHYFRFIGFLMALVTVVAAGGLVKALPAILSQNRRTTLYRVLIVLFLIFLPVSVLSIHNSPWIYQPGSQVTEVQMEGYEAAFEQRAPGIAFTGVRGAPVRPLHALYGPDTTATSEFPIDEEGIPERVFGSNLTTYYDEPRYIPVTKSDFEREVVLYKGFRFSREGFQNLDSTPGIDRIKSSNEFQLYLLTEAEGEPDADTELVRP